MQKQKRHGELPLRSLSSLTEFKAWIRQNISFYDLKEDVSTEDLLIYFDYIENKIRETQEKIDQSFWLKLVRGLRERLRVTEEEGTG